MDIVAAALELIEFLKNGDRDYDIVLFEVINTESVVQHHIGIEHEQLGGLWNQFGGVFFVAIEAIGRAGMLGGAACPTKLKKRGESTC